MATIKRKRRAALLGALIPILGLSQLPHSGQRVVRAATAPERPNILIILTDDQRADKDTYQVMPQTMRIFRDKGTFYRNAVATTPLCCPSRASILSGQYGHNHGVQGNGEAADFPIRHSIQYELQRNGYFTGVSGKYLGFVDTNPAFFDRWAIMRGGKRYYRTPMNVDGTDMRIKSYLTTFIRNKSIEFLEDFEESDQTPWFLMVAPYAPHLPTRPENRYIGTDVPAFRDNPATVERDLSDKPEHVRRKPKGKRDLKELRRDQLLTLKSADDLVAGVFTALNDLDEKNTLAFFLSDNGFMWFEHGLTKKRLPYQHSVRIPFFVRWPRHLPRGRLISTISGNIDVAPTIFQAARIDPHYLVDGRSLLEPGKRDSILLEYWREQESPKVPTWKALWTPRWKYIEYETGEKEYYEDNDRWELHNAYGNQKRGDEPPQESELSARLRRYSSCRGRGCP